VNVSSASQLVQVSCTSLFSVCHEYKETFFSNATRRKAPIRQMFCFEPTVAPVLYSLGEHSNVVDAGFQLSLGQPQIHTLMFIVSVPTDYRNKLVRKIF